MGKRFTRILLRVTIMMCAIMMAAQTLSAQQVTVPEVSDSTAAAVAAKPVYSDIYLDTVKINTKFIINDYTLVGVNYGVQLMSMMFTPVKSNSFDINPVYFGVTYTKYGKMFGFMPYFGLQTGLFYGKQGFTFKPDKKDGSILDMDGATRAIMEVVEVPFLTQLHYDAAHFKIMVDAGIYGGYRYSIERTFPWENDPYEHSFKDTDIKLDYGLKGGAGIGLMFDPFEFHIKAQVKYGWSSLYQPDYASEYYYRYAYPLDVCITAGLHIQLTKRTGKTKKDLKKEAWENVFGPTQNQ